MQNRDGAMVGLIAGIFYFLFVLLMGWEGTGSLSFLYWVSAASAITFLAITALSTLLPPSRIWLYPLSFALPTLLVGVLQVSSDPYLPTLVLLGLGTFMVGLASAFHARHRANSRLPSSDSASANKHDIAL